MRVVVRGLRRLHPCLQLRIRLRRVILEGHSRQGTCPVPYKLIRLAPGSYDLFLDGVVVANPVQARVDRPVWVAELLLDLPIGQRPFPFKRLEHTFSSFELARAWLGHPEIVDSPPDRR